MEELQELMHPLPSSSKNFVKHLIQIAADEHREQSVIFPPVALHLLHFMLPDVESDQIYGSSLIFLKYLS